MISIENKALKNYTFIDLFAGIGGFHIALSSYGANCVFASEWDEFAASTYHQNFQIKPFGDITKIKEQDIPQHNILCGGFPCQAFSIAGKQKGFNDIRGTLFFEIARIVNHHKPKIIFLENVKNLVKHNKGNTLETIKERLLNLGYNVFTKVLNASNFDLPQNRERLYIVAFRSDIDSSTFKFPKPINTQISLSKILENEPNDARIIVRDDINIYKKINVHCDDILTNKPIQIGKVNKGRQGERIYHPSGHAITLSAYGGGIGSKTGLYLVDGKIRKLSPRECARVQGFPENFTINTSATQAYKQFGNSVSINVLQAILFEIANTVNKNG